MSILIERMRLKREALRTSSAIVREIEHIMSGFRVFHGGVAQELEVLHRTRAALKATGERYQRRQLNEIDDAERELKSSYLEAESIMNSLCRTTAHSVDGRAVSHAWARVDKLLERERHRQFRNLRVQGQLVQRTVKIGQHCQRQQGEAAIQLIDKLNCNAADSTSGMQHLWRFIMPDGSIWLYHHEPVEKWKCMFFRICINRLGAAIRFSLESFIPFGFGNDPTPYKLGQSEVYTRPGWQTNQIVGTSYTMSNTINLNVTKSKSFGTQLGRAVSTSNSETDTTGTNQSSTENLGETSAVSQNTGWSQNRGSSSASGYSHTSQGGMGLGFGGSSTRSTNRGSNTGLSLSGGSSQSSSTMHGVAETSGTSKGKSVQNGTSSSDNTAESTTVSESESTGFTSSGGEILQIKTMAFGRDLGAKVEEHLEQWRMYNSAASNNYDLVHDGFATAVDAVIRLLEDNATQSSKCNDRTLDERRNELNGRILLESEYLSERREDISNVTGPAVNALPQSGGVKLADPETARRLVAEPLQIPSLTSNPPPRRLPGIP